MEPIDGHEFFDTLIKKDQYKDIPFIFLTSRTDTDEKIKSLQKGVIDYICKPFDVEVLLAKIKTIIKSREMYLEKVRKKIERKIYKAIKSKGDEKFLHLEKMCQKYVLSPREKEVLQRILHGLQIIEIADMLFLSEHTVRNHIRKIYRKCKVQNRIELMNIFKE